MSTTTPVLGLTLPAGTEDVDISVLNTDFTKLDTAIGFKSVKTTITTLANSTAETVLYSLTLGANSVGLGSVYKMVAWGQASTTATPTLTFRLRLGGVGGTVMAVCPAITTASGIANKGWRAEGDLILVASPGASAGWQAALRVINELNTVAPNNAVAGASNTSGGILLGSDVSRDWVLTAQWSAASASNTLGISAGYAHRVTNS
jgi:hypothetical protein